MSVSGEPDVSGPRLSAEEERSRGTRRAPGEPTGAEGAANPPGAQAEGRRHWQRLDPRTIVVEAVVPGVSALAGGVLIGLLTDSQAAGSVSMVIAAVAAVGVVVVSAWAWRTTHYRVTETHVEVRKGLLVRTLRSVPRDRLRSVDLTADLVHRVGGVTVVAIGTGRQGGDADDSVTLRSVSRAEGERLRAELLRRVPQVDTGAPEAVDAAAPTAEPELARFAASWVLLGPLSLLGLIAVGGLAGVVGQFSEAIDWRAVASSGPVRDAWDYTAGLPIVPTVLVALVGLVVLNSVLSTVLYVVLYGGFRLVRADDATLRLTYGLLTRRSVSIEEARLRGVRVDEPLLLRLGRGAKAKVIAAGVGGKGADGKEKRDGDLLLPAVPAVLAHSVTAQVLGTPTSPALAPLRRHPVAAVRALLFRWVPWSTLPSIGLAVPAVLVAGFPDWPWRAALVFVGLAVVGAVLEYAHLGHALVGEHLVVRSGSGVRRTAVVRSDAVIAWRFRRPVWQRRPRLLSAAAAVAAGSGAYWIRFADQDDALGVARDAVPGWLDQFLEPDES